MDSYTFSPVPWKGYDPLRRIKSTTPNTGMRGSHTLEGISFQKFVLTRYNILFF